MDDLTMIMLGLKRSGKMAGAALKMKRPFALKVSGMQGKVPKEAPEEEQNHAKVYWAKAFVYQQLQETAKELAKKLDSCYDQIKKDQKAIEKAAKKGKEFNSFAILTSPDYKTCSAYNAIVAEDKNNPGLLADYMQEIKAETPKDSEIDKKYLKIEANDTVFDYAKRLIDEYNNAPRSNAEELRVATLAVKSVVILLKGLAVKKRGEKIKQKKEYGQYLKQIKNGLKLAQKLGEITRVIPGKYTASKTDEWKSHEKDEGKLTPERITMIKCLVTSTVGNTTKEPNNNIK